MKKIFHKYDNKKMSIRAKKASYSFFWMLIFLLITSIGPFITRAFIVHFMGLDYAGLVSLFNSVLNVLNLTELGLGEALIFYLYKPMAENDISKVNSLLNLYKKIYFCIGIVIIIFSVILTPFLPMIVNGECPTEINLIILYFLNVLHIVVSYFCFPYAISIFQTNQSLYYDYRMRSFVWLVIYGTQIVIIYYIKDFYLYTFVFFVGNIAFNLLDYIMAKRYFPQYIPKGKVDKQFLRELSVKVFAMSLGKLRKVFRNSVDSIIISTFLGLSVLAMYNNYYCVMVIPSMLISIFNNAILQSLGNSVAIESKESNQAVVNLFSFVVQWISIVCSVLLLCLYKIFMIIWLGEEHIFPLHTEVLFVIYFYILQITTIPTMVRNSAGIWEEGKWYALIETVFNLILNIVFVHFWNVNGILFATIISLVIFNIPVETTVVFKNYFGKNRRVIYGDYLYNLGCNGIICVVCYHVCEFIQYESLIVTLIIKGILVFLIANIMLVFFHCKDSRMHDIWNLAKELMWRNKDEK